MFACKNLEKYFSLMLKSFIKVVKRFTFKNLVKHFTKTHSLMIRSLVRWARQLVAKVAATKTNDGGLATEVVILTIDVGDPVTRSTVLVLEVR